MHRDKTTQIIVETNRDVKWICKILGEIREANAALEERVRRLEVWQSEKIGEEQRDQDLPAEVGASAGGFLATLLRIFIK